MNIKINGENETITSPTTVAQLLTLKNVEMPDMVSVQLGGEFVERQLFSSTTLKEGDEVDFLYFMGGGSR
jgi:sulfur carrier protein